MNCHNSFLADFPPILTPSKWGGGRVCLMWFSTWTLQTHYLCPDSYSVIISCVILDKYFYLQFPHLLDRNNNNSWLLK